MTAGGLALGLMCDVNSFSCSLLDYLEAARFYPLAIGTGVALT